MTPLVASALDRPPAVLAGLTAPELGVVVVTTLPPSIAVGLLLFAPLGVWPIGVVAGLPIEGAAVAALAHALRAVKRGRPANWLQGFPLAWLADRGWMRCPYLRHEGPWEVR